MNIDLITMPISKGSGRKGAELGPRVLIDSGVGQWLEPHHVVRKDIVVDECDTTDKNSVKESIREVAREVSPLRETVYESLRSGHLPLVVGGDHSLTWGSLAGTLDEYEDAWCVYIDAHGDINTPEGSPSGHVHGMHLSFLTGIRPVLEEVPGYMHRHMPPGRLKFLATRSLDECECRIAEHYSLDITSSDDIHSRGIAAVTVDLRKWLARDDVRHIHLSFDIDAVDPSYAPGTGVPVDGGISSEEAVVLIETILSSGKVVTVDVVEFNPLLDQGGATVEVLRRVFFCIAEVYESLGAPLPHKFA